jgi:glycosyltransferase involved in cell wall biosynthesis
VTSSVSVIICCYTEERLNDIRDAVVSVQRQTRPPKEIILSVDNEPALYGLLTAKVGSPVRLVLNESAKGLSATRNAGISVASGDLLAFLDDDAVAEPEWLARLTAPFGDPSVFATSGRAVLSWSGARPVWFPEELEWIVGGSLSWLPSKVMTISNPQGHNMCFRRDVFATVGMFETSLGRCGDGGQAGEEREFSLRLARRFPHANGVYEPAAVIHHKVPLQRERWSYLVRRSYQEGLSKGRIGCTARIKAALAPEIHYLRFLLFRAMPHRLIRLWSPTLVAQLFAITFCIAATAAGYIIGTLRFRKGSSKLSPRTGR